MGKPGLTFYRFVAIFIALALTVLPAQAAMAASVSPGSGPLLLADTTPPIINVWYDTNQTFNLGTSQNWINIVGNVSDPENGGAKPSLSYSLNGSSFRTLSVGPDQRRLAQSGDFTIDIPINDSALIKNGNPNTVVIRAVNAANLTTNRTVTFTYNASTVWPLPYTINWNTITKPQQAVQVVDGIWQVSPAGIRSTQVAYDRVLAIGDLTWKDYEVLVPVTINSIDFSVIGDPISGGPALGIDLRWTGHTTNPVNCPQPECGWLPTGGPVRYSWTSQTSGRLQIEAGAPTPRDTSILLVAGSTYWFRVRAETNASGTLYSARYWVDGSPEPSNWTLTKQTAPGSANYTDHGSFLLVAHHIDATFGNLTATPLGTTTVTYTLNVSTNGNGSVTKNPNKSSYLPGETVTLTAAPAAGWQLQSWSDSSTTALTRQVVVNSNMNITATFRQIPVTTPTTPTPTPTTTPVPNLDVLLHMPMVFR